MSKKKPPKRVYVSIDENGFISEAWHKRKSAKFWLGEGETVHAYQLVEPRKARS